MQYTQVSRAVNRCAYSTGQPRRRTFQLPVTLDSETVELASFEFDNDIAPQGYKGITRFRRDIGAHFDYDLGGVKLTKSIYLLPDTDAIAIVELPQT